ncbi:MAG: PQQ-dependent sugar dehydrogenase [Rhizobiales bacterium]|nr:PQQ-dependent sugar dehydrogenase [Hyphomicrobiales bacterium]
MQWPSRPRRWFAAAALYLAALLSLVGTAVAQPALNLQLVASGFSQPLGIVNARDGSNRLFIVEKGGRIRIYNGTQVLGTPFLDISAKIVTDSERGLLGLAFDANYASNGLFYIYYTSAPSGTVTISRYSVSGSPNIADPNSEVVLKTQDHSQFGNHDGGSLLFGSDGCLYAGIGDGGSGGDPNNNGQNLNTLLGKIIRINPGNGAACAAAPGNPFVGMAGARDEIWALGLRNPWRITFDRLTDDLLIADVGQNIEEEINFQPAGVGGRNYCWRHKEGLLIFDAGTACTAGIPTDPVLVYDHTNGRCSITGGYRYRGGRIPDIYGTYFYGDFCTGEVWSATASGGVWSSNLLLDTAFNISTFGEDESGEIYVADLAGGAIYRLVDTRATTATALTSSPNPSVLGQTVAFTATVTGSGATGTVTFMEGAATLGTGTLSGGAASFSTSSLAVGMHTITAVYGSDASFGASTSPALTQTVVAMSLQVTPPSNMASVGNPGGPFFPASFQYQLSSNGGALNYSITGLPSWLDVSSSSGTVTTPPTTITFTVNASANSLPVGGYNATIGFANTTNGLGNQTRNAALTVNSGGTASPATRTWVSGAGNDGYDCTLVAPCQTFAGALPKTSAGGEINCLDAGGFGVVTIDKSLSIMCEPHTAGVLAASGNGITINVGPSDQVVLQGLDIEGLGTGMHGVHIIGGGSVIVRRSSIHGFTGNGINLVGTANAKLLLQDSVISRNGGGVNVQGSFGAANTAVIDRTTFETHTSFAVQSAQGGAVYLSASSLIGTGQKLAITGGGTVTSYGNNVIRGASAAPTSTLPRR